MWDLCIASDVGSKSSLIRYDNVVIKGNLTSERLGLTAKQAPRCIMWVN